MIDIAAACSRIDYRIELLDSTEDQQRAFLAGLEAICREDTPHLNELRDWLRSLLESEAQIQPQRDRYYQQEGVKCGKHGCKCSKGQLHGPYWYLYQRKGGKLIKKYVGKRKPPDA